MTKFHHYISYFFGSIAITIGLACAYPTNFYLLQILNSFLPQGAALNLIAGILFFALRLRVMGIAFFITSTVLSIPLLYWQHNLEPRYITQNNDETLTILHFNVLKSNYSHAEILDIAKQSNADIISFQEVNSRWLRAIKKELTPSFPYYASTQEEVDFFGLCICSKTPFTTNAIEWTEKIPWLNLSTVLTNGSTLRIVAVHALPPKKNSYVKQRNKQLDEIKIQLEKHREEYKIVVGDLNTVPWNQNIFIFL